jgi:lipid-binding SYLF domain-containing protein
MQEVLNLPDSIPKDLLEKTECVIAIPSVRKLAFGAAASYGRGVLAFSCVFAGVSLEGSTLDPDDDGSEQVYGRAIKATDIIRSENMAVPATGRLSTLCKRGHLENESERTSIK